MLRTECPSCNCAVTSPFLAEAEDMECPNCGTTFTVKDVCISAGPYSIYREVLLKNIHKYVRLLREAREELEELEEQGRESLPFRESARTVKMFMERLKELLDGCRERLRVSGGNTPLVCRFDKRSASGTLLNISATGLCLKVNEGETVPSRGQEVNICFDEPGSSESFCLTGRVMWTSDDGLAGMRFEDLEGPVREALERFVTLKSEAEDID